MVESDRVATEGHPYSCSPPYPQIYREARRTLLYSSSTNGRTRSRLPFSQRYFPIQVAQEDLNK